MFRTPTIANRFHSRAPVSLRCASTAVSTSSLPAPAFTPVKFQKENVEEVMKELPAFNFYEIKEPTPNPYKGYTLDKSILLDAPSPVLTPPQVEFSKLENGLKIASIDKQGLTAHLGLYVDAGSRYENSSNFGVSHMTSLMAYASTAHLGQLRTVKTLEQMGANNTSTCTAGREEMIYRVDVMREYMPMVLPLMVGNILFPRLLPWEVKAATKKVKAAREAFEADPDAIVNELLHKAAYCNNTLGQSPLATDRSMSYFTPDTIRNYMLDHFAPERMVVVGVNVAHSELAKWTMRAFADYNAIPIKNREKQIPTYTGGDLRLEGPSPFCHLAVGFESVPWGQHELAPVSLLQTLLGGGSKASSGLGSGVTSRLSTKVLQPNAHVESCAAFNTSYSDSGMFGVYGVSHPSKAGDMAMAITKTLNSLTSVTSDELAQAKAMLKGRMFRQADDGATLMQDLGQQLLLSGKYGSVADFAKIVDGVTEGDLVAAARKILSSKLTIAAYGDTHMVPHYDVVAAQVQPAKLSA